MTIRQQGSFPLISSSLSPRAFAVQVMMHLSGTDLAGFCLTVSSNIPVLVQLSRSVVSDSLRLHELQHARPPCPSPTPGVYSNSCPLSRWCHPIISSSVVPFFSRLQYFPASGSFQMRVGVSYESVLTVFLSNCMCSFCSCFNHN